MQDCVISIPNDTSEQSSNLIGRVAMEFISSPEAQKASHSIGVVKDIRHLFAKHKAKDLGCCHLILRQPQELKVKDGTEG